MAKVGRAAYAASRARLEVVTADKTITKNESGELYAIDAAAALAITLPSDPESGTRYKFMIIDDVGSGDITITTGTVATQPFQGGILFVDSADTSDSIVKADGAASGDDVVTIKSDALQGSHITCVYDSSNSRWLLEGMVSGETPPTLT